MLKNAVTSLAMAAAIVAGTLTGGGSASAAGPVDFDRVDSEQRGGMQHGSLEQCVNKVYTPVADDAGNLRMIGMGVVGNDLASLPETGSEFVGGAVNEIAITRLNGCNYVVTAVRTQNNGLKLISWASGANGFDRLHDTGDNGLTASEVAITSFPHPSNNHPGAGVVVTAQRGSSGSLLVQTWSVNPETGINYLAGMADEEATQISIVAVEPGADNVDDGYIGRVVVAFRTAAGNLKLISWNVDVWGALHRNTDSGNQAGAVTKVALVKYDTRRVVTAVRNGDGNLQLIPWRLTNRTDLVRMNGENDPTFNDPYAGKVSEVAITAFDFNYDGFDYVATAVRTHEGTLRVIAWGIDSSGNIKRHGDTADQAGAATHIEIGWSQESGRLVTSMRDADGNLKAVAWRVY